MASFSPVFLDLRRERYCRLLDIEYFQFRVTIEAVDDLSNHYAL